MQPHSLAQAVSFARLHEEKLLDSRRQGGRSSPTTTFIATPARLSSSPSVTPPESILLSSVAKPRSSTIPFKRLTLTELALRREQGLCFNYDEKYSCGHKCASSLFLFVTEEDEYAQEIDPGPSLSTLPPFSQDSSLAQISLHALFGQGARRPCVSLA